MRELYLKRNELNKLSQNLRSAKFEDGISKEQVTKLVETQKDVYNRFKFYDNFLKIGGKIYAEQIRSKKR